MQIIGKEALVGYNLNDLNDLNEMKEKFEKKGLLCELIDLTLLLDDTDKDKVEPGYMLIIRKGINKLISKYNLNSAGCKKYT